MSNNSDYALSVGVELNTASISELTAEINRRLSSINITPKLNVSLAAADNIVAVMGKIVGSAEKATAAVAKVTSGMSDSQAINAWNDYDRATNKAVAANERAAASFANVGKVAQQTKAEIASFYSSADGRMTDAFNAENMFPSESEVRSQAAAYKARMERAMQGVNIQQLGQKFNSNLVMQEDPAILEKRQAILDKYVPKLQSAVMATQGLNVAEKGLLENSHGFSHLLQSMSNQATWMVSTAALFGGAALVVKGFRDAMHSQQEQVVQGFYYQGAGKQFTPEMSAETQSAALDFARKYGVEAIKAQEAIGLWAKDVKGELVPSLQMANDALKMNVVTGMNNEELFRSTTAVLAQYHLSMEKSNELWNIGLLMATKYGGGIKMIGGESQDAARQMLEAIDSSAAVTASFGLTMQESAAANAVIIGTGNKSGSESGGGLSKALAALEKGAPQQAMARLGIAMHDNKNLLDQLFEDWNKKVPGMGNTLNNILSAHVSPYALEPLKLLMGQVGTYKKALQAINDMEKQSVKDQPLEKMFASIKNTDSFKLQQFVAGLDAAAIVIGRKFLPELGKALDFLDNSFIPGFMNNAKYIASFAQAVGGAIAVIATIETIKFGMSGINTLIGQWRTLGSVMGMSATEASLSEQIVTTSITAEQRALMGLLATDGEVTAEMELQFKTLAMTTGRSLDSMILEFLKLKGVIVDTAAQVDLAEESMSTTMASVAEKMGVEAVAVEGSFGVMATAAESSAMTMQAAFSSVIPVIGQVIAAGWVAVQVSNMVKDKIENVDSATVIADKYNPSQRHKDEAYYAAQIQAANTHISRDRAMLTHSASMMTPGQAAVYGYEGWGGLKNPKAQAADITQWEEYKKKMVANYHAVKDSVPLDGNVTDMLHAAARQTKLNLLRQKPFGDATQETGAPNVTMPKVPGTSSASSDYASGTGGIAAQYATEIASKQAIIDATTSQIDRIKTLIEVKGNSKILTDKLITADNAEITSIKAKANVLYDESAAYTRRANIAREKASHYAPGTTQHNQFNNQANADDAKAAAIKTAANALGVSITVVTNNILKAVQSLNEKGALNLVKLDETKYKSDLNSFKTGGGMTIAGLQADKNTYQQQLDSAVLSKDSSAASRFRSLIEQIGSAISTAQKKFQDFDTATTSSLQNSIQQNMGDLSTVKSWDKTFNAAMRSAADNVDKFNQKIALFQSQGMPSGEIQKLQQLEGAWYASAQAVAEYNRALAEAKASPTYTALSAGIDAIGGSLTNTLVNDAFNGPINGQIQGIMDQINVLNSEKSIIDTGPNAKYHKYQSSIISQQIKTLEAEIKHLQEVEKNPPIFKKIFETIEKSFMNTFIKDFENKLKESLLKGLTDKLLPKATVDIQKQATQLYADSTSKFLGGTNTYGTSVQQFVDAINNGSMNVNIGSSGGFQGLGAGVGGSLGSIAGLIGSGIGAGAGGSVGMMGGGTGGGGSTMAGSAGSFSNAAGAAAALTLGSGAIGAGAGASVANFLGGSSASGGGGGSYSQSTSSLGSSLNDFAGNSTLEPYTKGLGSTSAQNAASAGASVGGGAGGAIGHASFLKGALGAAGGLGMAIGGYKQGGFQGALMAGLGMDSAITSVASLFTGGAAAFLGAAAPWLAVAAALFTLFQPHYSPETNPDMYANDGYAQGAANLVGQSYTQANGWVSEDATLKQQLGGMSELAYMDQWYNAHPGGQGLNSDALALWNTIGTYTGGGKAVGIGSLHQGVITLVDSGGSVVNSGNWQDILNQGGTDSQNLYSMLSAGAANNTPIISMNQYGGSSSGMGNVWDMPGMTSSELGQIGSAPYGQGSTLNPGYTVGGSSGSPSSASGGVHMTAQDQNMMFVHQLNLDGRTIAEAVGAYRAQRESSGYMANY